METIRVTATKLGQRAARFYMRLPADQVPRSIIRIPREGEDYGGVYKVYPWRGEFPEIVFDGLVRMMDARQHGGTKISIEYTSNHRE